MNPEIQTHIDDLLSNDRERQSQGFMALMAATEQPVDWSYSLWDHMVADLTHKDNRQRAHAAQLLANLAKSDPEGRMLNDFDALLHVTRDDRFVPARHALQAIWKVGLAGDAQKRQLIDGLEQRFAECGTEKNSTLIRYDILQGLRHLYDAAPDDSIRETALALIETETDARYRKKYATVWRAK